MSIRQKQALIATLGFLFLISLVFVQYEEVTRRRVESGLVDARVIVPASSQNCVDCHRQLTPGIIDHWQGSTHAAKGVSCYECHAAEEGDPDAFDHYGARVATIVTPRDCAACHPSESAQFARSHHAAGGQILHSLDNFRVSKGLSGWPT